MQLACCPGPSWHGGNTVTGVCPSVKPTPAANMRKVPEMHHRPIPEVVKKKAEKASVPSTFDAVLLWSSMEAWQASRLHLCMHAEMQLHRARTALQQSLYIEAPPVPATSLQARKIPCTCSMLQRALKETCDM